MHPGLIATMILVPSAAALYYEGSVVEVIEDETGELIHVIDFTKIEPRPDCMELAQKFEDLKADNFIAASGDDVNQVRQVRDETRAVVNDLEEFCECNKTKPTYYPMYKSGDLVCSPRTRAP